MKHLWTTEQINMSQHRLPSNQITQYTKYVQVDKMLSACYSLLKNLKCSRVTVTRQMHHLKMLHKLSQPQRVKQRTLSASYTNITTDWAWVRA